MNFHQLEYIIAVDTFRHFGKAAESCFVTQPTLSMMIQKLEEEIGVTIFDRSKQPVIPTIVGTEIIQKAKTVLKELREIKEIASIFKDEIHGELKIGIIPTVAPYLLPHFLKKFLMKYPVIKLRISEHTTEIILEKLERGILDVGVLATPLNNRSYFEQSLYREEFVVYASKGEKILNKKYLLAEDINVEHLWLLEEGHCLRSQIVHLCELKKQAISHNNLHYEAGSIDSLIKIVDQSKGITILPELATLYLNKKQKLCIRHFKPPVPVREISLVTYRYFVKASLLEALKKEILDNVHIFISQKKKQIVIEI
ncbi:MAG: LysR family transcriptional regulator [Bacteroidetes bacterium]|nr:LysR family transcriptional regulator [Bacteroidota bacterium]MBU2586092.1 LysR family transcriptional regulator [Bacteroidota bacterium]